jgi:hypothetical protein
MNTIGHRNVCTRREKRQLKKSGNFVTRRHSWLAHYKIQERVEHVRLKPTPVTTEFVITEMDAECGYFGV